MYTYNLYIYIYSEYRYNIHIMGHKGCLIQQEMENEKWLSDMCLQIFGEKEKTTLEYLKAVARKSQSLSSLERSLRDFDCNTENNPRNATFACELLSRFGRVSVPHRPAPVLSKPTYSLVPMTKDTFTTDPEAKALRMADNLTKEEEQIRDAKERDEFAYRLSQQKTNETYKKFKNRNIQGVSLTEEEKYQVMPEVRMQSRMKFLDKREKEELEKARAIIKDEEEIFHDEELTTKEIKMRQVKKKLIRMAEINAMEDTAGSHFQMQDDQTHKPVEDRKIKALHARYQEVAKPLTETQLWELSQGTRATIKYRTIDPIELSMNKNYDLILNNQVKFVKKQILARLIQQHQQNDANAPTKNNISQQKRQEKSMGPQDMKFDQQLLQRLTQIQVTKRSLPIFNYRDQLLKLIEENQIIIMVGETGSGKTTQLPQYLHECNYTKQGKIGCTQPRRVAAMSVAARVSQQMNVELGAEVGYCIRFEDNTSECTIIKYLTDGMLLREFLTQPDLIGYSVLIIDEAHERSLHTDIVLTLAKDLCNERKDLKVIISSATLEAEKFSSFFGNAPIIRIPGRRFPVDIYYTANPQANYVQAAILTILQIHLTQDKGDILVFLTGQEEIEEVTEELRSRLKGLGSKVTELLVLPLYASLPSEQQAKVFDPVGRTTRKCILATNIAETSVTIDGIVYVIDSGLVKQTAYNPRSGLDSLVVVPISKASANQRAGRAGRVCAGKCFRLYTLWSYEKELEESTVPQIQRTNICSVILQLKSMGIDDMVHFDFLDPPPHDMLAKGLQTLYALGALNDKGALTKLGRRMAQFPLDPMQSKMLVQSEKYECVEQSTTVCAMLSVGNVFIRPREQRMHADNAKKCFFKPGGDHLALLAVFDQWKENNYSIQWCQEHFLQARALKRARDVKEQLLALLERVEVDTTQQPLYGEDNINIRKCILSGYFLNCAKQHKGSLYKTVKSALPVLIHPSSLLLKDEPYCLIYHQLVLTSKEYMRTVMDVSPQWLIQIAPHLYSQTDFNTPNK